MSEEEELEGLGIKECWIRETLGGEEDWKVVLEWF